MPETSLDLLSTDFYPLACRLIAHVAQRGVPVAIICTRRTADEQQVALINGASGTTLSSHLPRSLRWRNTTELPFSQFNMDKSDAIDICPYEVYQQHGPDKLQWDGENEAFGVIGEEAEKIGLRWGGRWMKPFDPGHAELALPWKVAMMAEERKRPWPKFRKA